MQSEYKDFLIHTKAHFEFAFHWAAKVLVTLCQEIWMKTNTCVEYFCEHN